MKGILALQWRDLRHATSNTMAIIVTAGLVIIPSLFTWFNVIASWNPFDNTKNLTVAVANTDEGYQSDLVPIRVNIGEQVVASLRANDQLDWVITSEDDAVDGTKSGKYYAAIVLPHEFSADMMTFYAQGGNHTSIDYYTNEKKNALAPKITGQGATEVSSQINDVFTETLSEVGLNIITSLSDYLDADQTQAALGRLQNSVTQSSVQLRAAAQTAELFGTLIGSGAGIVRSSGQLISDSGRSFSDGSDAIGGGVNASRDLAGSLKTATGSLSSALQQSAQSYDAVADAVDQAFADAATQSGNLESTLRSLADRTDQQVQAYTTLKQNLEAAGIPSSDAAIVALDDAISRQASIRDALNAGADDVANSTADATAVQREIRDLVDQAKASISDTANTFDTDLESSLNQLSTTISSAMANLTRAGQSLTPIVDGVSGTSNSLLSQLDAAKATTTSVSTDLNHAADTFDSLSEALTEAKDTGDFTALRQMIGGDPALLASELADPVGLDRIPVYPVASFGSAMAPLYTILSLWVGALLMSVAIKTDVADEAVPGHAGLKPHQRYFGRYGIFALIGLAQSTLVGVGNVLFVQIEPVHPFLLILAGWVTSLVFTLIVYTLVTAFANVGKALVILLLVMQISSSGGAYPLQVLPEWFQSVSPFLPATHAISAVRSAIAGSYGADYWVSLGKLLLFIAPALLLGLVLRKPLMAFNAKLTQAVESTKVL